VHLSDLSLLGHENKKSSTLNKGFSSKVGKLEAIVGFITAISGQDNGSMGKLEAVLLFLHEKGYCMDILG
tara:strand:- start:283 stop:492 length:210 start_codon:yes stop_codon:yes gene_type:complete